MYNPQIIYDILSKLLYGIDGQIQRNDSISYVATWYHTKNI